MPPPEIALPAQDVPTAKAEKKHPTFILRLLQGPPM